MPPQVFRHHHRVTYADCTIGNHVYYSRFLDILEATRGEFFRQLDSSFLHWQSQDTVFPVVECRLQYKTPARYEDVLTIELWPVFAQGVRLNFAFRITNEAGRLILAGETHHVCTDISEKPKRLPAELIAKLAPYLREMEEG
jgi:acyl-CoA thioester hydrolase